MNDFTIARTRAGAKRIGCFQQNDLLALKRQFSCYGQSHNARAQHHCLNLIHVRLLQHACSKNADRIIADTRTTAQINDDWQTSFFLLSRTSQGDP
jgi:hypothetical protein